MNLFEPNVAQEVLSRLNNITVTTTADWSKINAAQMMAHCRALKVYFGELKMKKVVWSALIMTKQNY